LTEPLQCQTGVLTPLQDVALDIGREEDDPDQFLVIGIVWRAGQDRAFRLTEPNLWT